MIYDMVLLVLQMTVIGSELKAFTVVRITGVKQWHTTISHVHGVLGNIC